MKKLKKDCFEQAVKKCKKTFGCKRQAALHTSLAGTIETHRLLAKALELPALLILLLDDDAFGSFPLPLPLPLPLLRRSQLRQLQLPLLQLNRWPGDAALQQHCGRGMMPHSGRNPCLPPIRPFPEQ